MDATAPADAGVIDTGVAVGTDASTADAAGSADATIAADGGTTDGAAQGLDASAGDAASPDASPPADAGVLIPDSDGDSISDADEGDGLVNSDTDLIPDSLDPDSDDDGIPDLVEAGDADVRTPPVDTDMDGIPDFRDTDSDNDGIPDEVEGDADPDGDRIGAFRDHDSDGDGIDDDVEGTADPDNDGQPSFLDVDADGDTILDAHEGLVDPDMDMVPAYLDLDSDGDTLADADEAGDTNLQTLPYDGDFDQTPDFLDLDSDNDTIADTHEGLANSDGDAFPDRLDIDSDNDSILDNEEAGDADLATPPVDSDNDLVADFRDEDSDNDTIIDLTEGGFDTDGDMILDRLDDDSDGDGWLDSVEAGDADPLTPPVDSDMDQLPDYRDLDSDGDTLADSVEQGCPGSTNRADDDSDSDGFVDPAEIAYGSDPCSGGSVIDDFYFILPPLGMLQSAPLEFTDTAIDRADFAINVDTTGSMEGEIQNIQQTLSTAIIPGVDAVIPDGAFSVSSFEDYPIDPFGAAQAGDMPFRLHTRVTTDANVAQGAVNQLTTRVGLDFPESGQEALYQIATGAGTSWNGGSVPSFNPNQDRVPNVADGSIGGVGFRDDALPVIVHVTDALSHSQPDYVAVDPSINAASTQDVRNALGGVGARVVTISSLFTPLNDLVCNHQTTTFFGAIDAGGGDVDWFELSGAVQGDTVTIEVWAQRLSSTLDARVAIANAIGVIAQNDDLIPGQLFDGGVAAVLVGPPPFYVAVAESNDTGFFGSTGASAGHYLTNIGLNGQGMMPTPSQCAAQHGGSRINATTLVQFAQSTAPASAAQCISDCQTILGPLSPLFQDFTYPEEMSTDTQAVIPPCSWSEFGPSRPLGCGVNECCTGLNGQGVPPNAAGQCPLQFQIDDNGAGIDQAMVSGIEALVKFSSFTVTTVVRPDPAELASSGLDTTCFIHGVIPTSATPPNSCTPQPTTADLVPPSPELDSFENVAPGTVLRFSVNAVNDAGGGMPCVPSQVQPQLFRAFIDVVADGVTVVDTRDVIVIVPATPPGGSN